MPGTSDHSRASRFLITAAAFVIVIAGMKAAESLLTPFLLAVFISVIAAPPLFFLQKRGFSTGMALLSVLTGIVLATLLLATLVGGSLDDFSANLPEYQKSLQQQTGRFLAWLASMGVKVPGETLTSTLDPAKAMQFAGKMLSRLGNVLANTFLIILTVAFILFEASHLPAKLRSGLRDPEASLQRLSRISANINRYMVIKTLASAGTGAVVAIWLAILGVDFPVLWGTLAFLLNYVPNIGSIIAAVPAILLAVIQFGPGMALWVAAGYLVVNMIVGNLIEPKFMGRGLGLSTLVVFVSLIFWGWVLGPVGMFLSVPLTMTLKIVLDASDDTRGIALMLGSEMPEEDASEPEA